MKRVLVLVDDTDDHRTLLEEAGDLCDGIDAELDLLTLLTEDDLEEGLEAIESIADHDIFSQTAEPVNDAAVNMAVEIAEEVLGDRDLINQTIGRVVEDEESAETILSVAEDNDIDHVFITGRRRSPTGKAIFGDTAQSVALNYEGPVTIITT